MKKKEKAIIKPILIIVGLLICFALIIRFNEQFLSVTTRLAVFGAQRLMPTGSVTLYPTCESSETDVSVAATTSNTTEKATVKKEKESSFILTETPADISDLIKKAKETAEKDKKDGSIYEKQYKNEGVTDSYKNLKVKNTNETSVNIEKLLNSKADLSVNKKEPTVLIFHTHTTESYQILDRDFYAEGFTARSNDEKTNMVRVGEEIVKALENKNIGVLHDKVIHDARYSGAYDNSKETVVEYLKKYPSIQVVLDVHRDAIQETDGTKIKPTAKIDGKKAAQIMIISGCQEDGNGVEDFPDWKENLVFALQLQNKAETMFPGLMRPLYFCPRRYNMNLTHCSLLVEFGSDANTLEEAVYSARMFGTALGEMLNDYKED